MTVAVGYEMLPAINSWDLETALKENFGYDIFAYVDVCNLLFKNNEYPANYKRLNIYDYATPDWFEDESDFVKYNLILWYLQQAMPEGTEAVLVNTSW